jgi:hypothetical protein
MSGGIDSHRLVERPCHGFREHRYADGATLNVIDHRTGKIRGGGHRAERWRERTRVGSER